MQHWILARTCPYEHYVVLLAICGLHLVDNDACESGSPSHQQRLVSYWLDSLVHEGPIFNKLKGPVWEVQCLSYTRFTSLIVYTLAREEGKEREKKEQRSQSTKGISFLLSHSLKKKRDAFWVLSLFLTHTHTHTRWIVGQTHRSGPRDGNISTIHHPLNKRGFYGDWGLVLPLRKHSADFRHTVRTHCRQVWCVPETHTEKPVSQVVCQRPLKRERPSSFLTQTH